MIRIFLPFLWSLRRPSFQSKHPTAIKVLLHRIHENDQSPTLYDEVFLKTRNLFETYQKISKHIKENPSLGLSSIFVGSCAKKPTNIGIVVIRQ
jgi:hypothetical protein